MEKDKRPVGSEGSQSSESQSVSDVSGSMNGQGNPAEVEFKNEEVKQGGE